MLKASIMFDNHCFRGVKGKTAKELKEKILDAYNDTYTVGGSKEVYTGDQMIAGWGNVTIDGISSDNFCIFNSLHKKKDLVLLDSTDIEASIKGKIEIYIKEQENNIALKQVEISGLRSILEIL